MSEEENWECRECKETKPRSDFYSGRKKCKHCVLTIKKESNYKRKEELENIRGFKSKIEDLKETNKKNKRRIKELEEENEKNSCKIQKLKESLKKEKNKHLEPVILIPDVVRWIEWFRKKGHTQDRDLDIISEATRHLKYFERNPLDYESPDKEV
jgi:hypothetical protein